MIQKNKENKVLKVGQENIGFPLSSHTEEYLENLIQDEMKTNINKDYRNKIIKWA